MSRSMEIKRTPAKQYPDTTDGTGMYAPWESQTIRFMVFK